MRTWSRCMGVAIVVLLGFGGMAGGDGVGFTTIGVWSPPDPPPDDGYPNRPFTIWPATPGQDDVIRFYERFEEAFSYDCALDIQRLGTPRMSVDRQASVVQFILEPLPPMGVEGCASVVSGYVTGLTGEFGPLEAGQWEYRGWSDRVDRFTVVPEPSLFGLGALGLWAMLRARWRRSGEGKSERRKLDPLRRASVEGLEARVLLSGPPTKFVIPIGGVPQIDWAIQAYTDRDPAPDTAVDYRGRGYTFDGSNSVHFGLADLAGMDRGVEIYAAAPGTVIEAHDGEFDRHVVILDPPPQDNYVLLDHGDGWRTRYGRMRNGSVAVSAGQVVTAGQMLGLVGGSGNFAPNYQESNAFLNFEVMHNGEHVETFLDPQAYWQSPPPFAGDVPTVFYMTASSQNLTNDVADGFQADEHILRRRVFHRTERVYTFTKLHGLNAGVWVQYRYFRPDGSWFTDTATPPPVDRAITTRGRSFVLGSAAQFGTWQVAAEFNGVEVGRTSFVVADPSEGLPEIKVFQDTTYVIDGRTTPIDFGSIEQDSGPSGRTFRFFNYGTQPLVVSDVILPAGFTMVSAMPTIEAGMFADVFIRLDDAVAGRKSGWVTLQTNDGDNPAFRFAVKETSSGFRLT